VSIPTAQARGTAWERLRARVLVHPGSVRDPHAWALGCALTLILAHVALFMLGIVIGEADLLALGLFLLPAMIVLIPVMLGAQWALSAIALVGVARLARPLRRVHGPAGAALGAVLTGAITVVLEATVATPLLRVVHDPAMRTLAFATALGVGLVWGAWLAPVQRAVGSTSIESPPG
jgi:hypothetical protein